MTIYRQWVPHFLLFNSPEIIVKTKWVRSKITDFYNWHFGVIAQDGSWICVLMLCLKSVCQVVVGICKAHLMQYLNNSSKWMSPSPTQRCVLKRQICLCNSLLSCGALDWIRGTRFLCFMALQGESLELENVLSDFITCRLFYWCVLFVKSSQTEYCSHSCQNHYRVMAKSGDGGINHPFDVWRLKKWQASWLFGSQIAL